MDTLGKVIKILTIDDKIMRYRNSEIFSEDVLELDPITDMEKAK